jgi:hypothetical protein
VPIGRTLFCSSSSAPRCGSYTRRTRWCWCPSPSLCSPKETSWPASWTYSPNHQGRYVDGTLLYPTAQSNFERQHDGSWTTQYLRILLSPSIVKNSKASWSSSPGLAVPYRRKSSKSWPHENRVIKPKVPSDVPLAAILFTFTAKKGLAWLKVMWRVDQNDIEKEGDIYQYLRTFNVPHIPTNSNQPR